MMDLLNEEEIKTIAISYGYSKGYLNWRIENYADKLIGYLGDHLRLIVDVELDGVRTTLKLFMKSMPRYDAWKANFLKEVNFFRKEYIMLSQLLNEFGINTGSSKWRPKLLFIREDLFIFEDVAELGYEMPNSRDTMSYDDIMAVVETLAKFHAKSIIYEEKKTKELGKPYRIADDYSDYLQEPLQNWRDVGRNAVIDFLKVYSTRKSNPNFNKSVESVVPKIFDEGRALMNPSSVYRNVVVHRDLWTNNIFLKKDNEKTHALIVDFQTVLYSSPMLDLSSLLFFNTTKDFRVSFTENIINFYYEVLANELKSVSVDIDTIFDKNTLLNAYEDSIMFGITQAAVIVPIVTMNCVKREELFSNPDTIEKINAVSRSKEFIEIARDDDIYRNRVIELFDEIVDRYVYPKTSFE